MCCWIYLFYTLFYDNRPHTHCNKSRLHGHIVIHPDNVHSLPNTRLRICCSDILQRKYPTFITLSDVNLIYTNLFLLIYEPMLFELFQIHNKKINALFCFGNQQCPGFQISFNLVILYHIEKKWQTSHYKPSISLFSTYTFDTNKLFNTYCEDWPTFI